MLTLRKLEREILMGAQQFFANPKLRQKHILLWSANRNAVAKDLLVTEVMAELPGIGIWVAIAKEHDGR